MLDRDPYVGGVRRVCWAYQATLADLLGLSRWAQLEAGGRSYAEAVGALYGRLGRDSWRGRRPRAAVWHAAGVQDAADLLLERLQAQQGHWAARFVRRMLPGLVLAHGAVPLPREPGGWGAPAWACRATALAAGELMGAGVLPLARRAQNLRQLRQLVWLRAHGGPVPRVLLSSRCHQGQLNQLVADIPAASADGQAPPGA